MPTVQVRVKEDYAKPFTHSLFNHRYHRRATPSSAVLRIVVVRCFGQWQDSTEQKGVAPAKVSMADEAKRNVLVRALPIHDVLKGFAQPEGHSKFDVIHPG